MEPAKAQQTGNYSVQLSVDSESGIVTLLSESLYNSDYDICRGRAGPVCGG